MKKIIAMSTALLLVGGAYAAGENQDLYSGNSDSKKFSTAVQPGVGDQYGSVLFINEKPDGTPNEAQSGSNDGYGSVLRDMGHNIDW